MEIRRNCSRAKWYVAVAVFSSSSNSYSLSRCLFLLKLPRLKKAEVSLERPRVYIYCPERRFKQFCPLYASPQPEGGVEEGQVFLAPLSNSYDGPRLAAPTGRWKDGLCDFFNTSTGICHSSFWCSLCCTQLAMAQAMTRLQVTWLGEPGPLDRTRQTFSVVLLLVVALFVYSVALELAALPYSSIDIAAPDWIFYLRFVGNLLFTLWAVIALCRTRATTRARYQIPEAHCRGCEDLCCSFWCSCCVTAQILRHTGEYENYAGTCCSMTGHPPGTPLVV